MGIVSREETSLAEEMSILSEELLTLGEGLRRAYPRMQPDPAFQDALYQRLLQQAQQTVVPMQKGRATRLVRALVGVAALSAAGVVVVLLRGRAAGASLYPASLRSDLGTTQA